jgi:hypothetical protein
MQSLEMIVLNMMMFFLQIPESVILEQPETIVGPDIQQLHPT